MQQSPYTIECGAGAQDRALGAEVALRIPQEGPDEAPRAAAATPVLHDGHQGKMWLSLLASRLPPADSGANLMRLSCRILQRLTSSSFVEASAKLAVGSVVAQGINVLALPVLALFYDPEAFGVFGIYFAISSFAGIFFSGRYELAIPVPECDAEAWGVFRMVGGLNIACIIFGLLFLLAWQPATSTVLGWTTLLLPFQAALLSQYGALGQLLNRHHSFSTNAFFRVLRNLTTLLAQLGLALTSLSGGAGLCLGFLGGSLAYFLLGHLTVNRLPGSSDLFQLDWKQLARKYYHNPTFLLAAHGLNGAGNHLPLFLLAAYHNDPKVVGYYFLATRILFTPVSLISQSLSGVFYPYAAENLRAVGNCWRLFICTTLFLCLIAMPAGVGLWYLLPVGIPAFLGHQWAGAGTVAKILVPFFAVKLVYSPPSIIKCFPRSAAYNFYWNVARFLIILTAFFAWHNASILSSIRALSLAGCIYSLLGILVSAGIARGLLPSMPDADDLHSNSVGRPEH